MYPDNLPRVNAKGGPEGRPGCWQKVTRDLFPAPYLVMDTGASTAPYNHLELGQPIAIEYVWGRQIGENTINPYPGPLRPAHHGLEFGFVGAFLAAEGDGGRRHRGDRDDQGTGSHPVIDRCSPSSTDPSTTATAGSSTSIVGTEVCSEPAWKADCCSSVAPTPSRMTRYSVGVVSTDSTRALGDHVHDDLGEHRDHAEEHPDRDGQQHRAPPVDGADRDGDARQHHRAAHHRHARRSTGTEMS